MVYRNRVIETLHLLEDIRTQVFVQLVNLASDGEMRETMELFEDGDYYTFELEHFENLSDANVNKLLSLCKDLETIFESIQNMNAVRYEEIQRGEDSLPFEGF
ncbi:hypothetical protein [Sphingobacterium psychroaquaticum]|uniref:Uncharacterized protein n=1 Tax=Sphingobacterium psychroaquaticum TaxID=561061 RepID=A0A1X7JNF0_9SPHI|nr:hypothetical protein [Sphingobacterium psychroaquaticum]QBQ40866.1 hypothetical protein E2P86_06760 [Sphingobacterium psychroaquaticum]SMG29427.1 hypothetical protein SAMN05660862_1926 [Sphingobacterium psychroaquaticum]